ncbi:MAG: hypothetical protein ACR2ND_03075 [Solirubrobacteraceae bacterium]
MTADLAAERAQRPRVAGASIAAGILLLLGALDGQFVVASGAPSVGLIQATEPALRGAAATGASPRAAGEAFINHHSIGFVLAALISGAGLALMAVLLRHLFIATRARREGLPAIGLVVGIWGPIAAGVFGLAFQIALQIQAHQFVHQADHSQHAVDQIANSTPLILASALEFASHFAIGFAFVIISLNAMRAGLLTRFMGVLGIISGAIFVFTQLSPLPVVQAFWLVALGVLLSGRGPSPLPAAWDAGVAIPWPSQQELREARQGAGAPAPAAAGEASGATPAPIARVDSNASKKRKRKRR